MSLDRFWNKVDTTGDCWLWLGARNRDGYGRFWMLGKFLQVHRFAYEESGGVIPEGMRLDHVCHTRNCVRPAHLRPTTQKQNLENSGVYTTSSTGVRGVHWDRRRSRYYTRVKHYGKVYSAGQGFATLAEAEEAAVRIRNALFTHNDADRIAS